MKKNFLNNKVCNTCFIIFLLNVVLSPAFLTANNLTSFKSQEISIKDSILFSEFYIDSGVFKASVHYVATDTGYVYVYLGTSSWSKLSEDSIFISAGEGDLTFRLTPGLPFEDGLSYNVCTDLKTLEMKTVITDCEVTKVLKPAIQMTDYTIDISEGTLNVSVDYTVPVKSYVSIFLGNMDWSFIAYDSLIVEGGEGKATFKIKPETSFANGTSYNVCADLKKLEGKTIITDCKVSKAQTVSVTQINGVKVQVYPNPSSDKVYVNLDAAGLYSLSLIDMSGQTLITTIVPGLETIALPVNGYRKGVYILKVEGKNNVENLKLVIK